MFHDTLGEVMAAGALRRPPGELAALIIDRLNRLDSRESGNDGQANDFDDSHVRDYRRLFGGAWPWEQETTDV